MAILLLASMAGFCVALSATLWFGLGWLMALAVWVLTGLALTAAVLIATPGIMTRRHRNRHQTAPIKPGS